MCLLCRTVGPPGFRELQRTWEENQRQSIKDLFGLVKTTIVFYHPKVAGNLGYGI